MGYRFYCKGGLMMDAGCWMLDAGCWMLGGGARSIFLLVDLLLGVP